MSAVELVTIANYPTQLLSLKNAATILSVSPWTVRYWIRTGQMASVKIGGRLLIDTKEIDRLIAAGTKPATSETVPMSLRCAEDE